MQLNISICLTFLRVLLIPCFVLFFYLPFYWTPFVTALIFVLAALTDWLDGFLARLWKQTTRFGAFLDPVADKIMVSIALILVTEHFHKWWITLPSAIMIIREIIITSLREWMAEIGKRNSITVLWVSKIKTSAQMLSLFILLWHPNIILVFMGIISLYIATILTFWSMFKYFKITYDILYKD